MQLIAEMFLLNCMCFIVLGIEAESKGTIYHHNEDGSNIELKLNQHFFYTFKDQHNLEYVDKYDKMEGKLTKFQQTCFIILIINSYSFKLSNKVFQTVRII